MKKSLISIAIASSVFSSCLFAQTSQNSQMAGVGVESTVATGYGLYAVTMRASAEPGAISSFYVYEQSGAFPARWREIDLEFTPGFLGNESSKDPVHPHVMAMGKCYQKANDNLPKKEDCTLQAFTNGFAGSSLSFNTYNHRAIDGEPYAHTNDQVFMAANSGNAIFHAYHTYYFYYTPNGIYWTKDLPAKKLSPLAPKQSDLPQPDFVKKDVSVVNNNPVWNPAQNPIYQAFLYDKLPLTPQKADGTLAESGALMKMSMNLWDGSNTGGSEPWGGSKSPGVTLDSNSGYQYVAFYPLTTPVKDVGSDPTVLTYGNAVIYSDFTTPQGTFLINQEETTFDSLWQVTNGGYLWPLGQLDERNIACGKGELRFNISTPYSTPRQNYEKLTACDWLNQD
ncbi:MAG TPA: family 16 glycosylhydrolase, partial [Gammaproteobacteria bacterium]|nr:family 16 glycosylhydrolase [Gammaproteobacteria bacterium]